MAKYSLAYTRVPVDERPSGRRAWGLLWKTSKPLAVSVVAWVVAGAVVPVAVIWALGAVVGAVPGAVEHGMSSAAGHRLIWRLVWAALVYGLSLIVDPVGSSLGIAARSRITSEVQQGFMAAVTGPPGVGHLEDAAVVDRMTRAEGTMTGFFPGDAPVTWAGIVASRVSGIVGCAVVAGYVWWLGVGLLVMWVAVRRFLLSAVVQQATELRGQTTTTRRAWYMISVGSRVRDAKEVRVFGLAQFIVDRFRAEYRASLDTGLVGLKRLHRRAAVSFLLVGASYSVALVTIAEQARAGRIGLGALAVLFPMVAVTSSVGSISFDDIALTWALAGLPDCERLEADLAPDPDALPGATAPDDRPRRFVRFERVAFRYPGAAADVLAAVDLELEAGTSTAIVGVNGAGKSTLVSLLARLRDPTSGRITVDGEDLRTIDATRWQRNVALMPQDPVRYPFSAFDNVAFGAIEHRTDRPGVERAARTAGFLDVVETLPNRWDTVLSPELPGGVDLSGGQWQRLALARALFATSHGARVLVLDEPTAALDARSEAQFYERFFEITTGLTTVVISHRFATVRRADRICVLHNGRITERGTHAELVEAEGQYAEMYRVQARRFAAPA